MTTATESPREQNVNEPSHGAVIRLDHVFKSFESREVLGDVSIEIPQGQAFGIVGKSGTGKSVTLKLMIGLLAADQGRVFLEGKDLAQLDHKSLLNTRKRIGFLFQGAALFDSLCVRDNVAFPLRRHTRKKEREIRELVQRALEEVGLKGEANKMPAELSGGMEKRAGLARALVMDPPIVLVDEPSSGLDVITASEIYDVLRKLKERGKTLVVVTHDGKAMHGIVDEIAVLDRGNIVAQGPSEELSKNENALVRTLVSDGER